SSDLELHNRAFATPTGSLINWSHLREGFETGHNGFSARICKSPPYLSAAKTHKLSDCHCLPGRGVPHSAAGFPARESASSWVRTSQSRPPKRTQEGGRPAAASCTL